MVAQAITVTRSMNGAVVRALAFHQGKLTCLYQSGGSLGQMLIMGTDERHERAVLLKGITQGEQSL